MLGTMFLETTHTHASLSWPIPHQGRHLLEQPLGLAHAHIGILGLEDGRLQDRNLGRGRERIARDGAALRTSEPILKKASHQYTIQVSPELATL